MLKRIIIILLVIPISLFVSAQSQDDIQTPKLIPPSPDAAALGKYGAIPVDKSTGIPSISIPMYEIKTPRFTLPISLSYHASGIKVDEISSWVGAGWTINAGGVITRSIVGFPDDGALGLITNHALIKPASAIQWPGDILYISAVVTRQLDTEPDNFFYNFNGHSGAFVFGYDTKPILIPYAPVKVNFDLPSDNFSIVDEQGNSYSFTTKENVVSSIQNMSGVSSWYLTQMVSADLSDTIKLYYTQDSLSQTDYSYNFSQAITNCGTGNTYALQPMVTTSNTRQYSSVRVSSIVFKGGKVDFITQGGRLDDGVKSLDSVIVSNLNTSTNQYTRLKSFALLTGYTYSTLSAPPNWSGSEADKHRLILTGLVENDGNNIPVKTHQFAYNPALLPIVHSFGQDLYGYFNGQSMNPSLLAAQNVVFSPFTGAPLSVAAIGGTLAANRNVSPIDMQAGILQRITYPTKGYTQFTYETNQETGTPTVPSTFGITAVGGTNETPTATYTPTNNMLATGGLIFHVQMSAISENPTFPVPYIKVVGISDGNLMYSLNADQNNAIDTVIAVPLATNIAYQLIAVAHGGTPGNSTDPYAIINTTYQVPTGGKVVNAGGLRVRSISNYNADGTLAGTETYKYGNNDQSGGGVQLSFSLQTFFSHATACVQTPDIPLGVTTTYSNNAYYPLASLNGCPVGYPSVFVYHGDTVINTGKSVYQYNIYPDSVFACSASCWNGIKPIPVSWKDGEPIEEDHYRSNGNNQYALVKSISNTYSIIGKKQGIGTIIGYSPEPITVPTDQCSLFVNPYVYNGNVFSAAGSFCQWYSNDFYWFDYPISTGIRVPSTTIVSDYDSTGTVALMSNNTTYYYDDTTLYMPTRTVSSDSRGRSMTSYTYRPLNQALINALTPLSPAATTAIDSMVSRNILTPVIQQAQYRNGNFTELTLNNYQLWSSSVIAPQNIQTQLAGYPLETRLQFNQYDATGNPLELQKTSDVKEVYLWGYHGQYPVAKILGTTYAVASTYITQSVLDNPPSDATLRSQLNNLRSIPGALVTSYTYTPLVGITSVTDPQGKTSYYEYDAFNRLKDIKDLNGNMIKTYDYHYAQ